jgi:hypothetical protein
VHTIGEGAFAGSGIISITLPASLALINTLAFQECTALQTV